MNERDNWLNMTPDELLRECDQEFRKARGHGGQKVNKTSCAVRLTHRATGFTVTADASRSQHENRLHAVAKLRRHFAYELRSEIPEDTQYELLPEPSVRNPVRLLWAAHVLDVLAVCGWEPKSAAPLLKASASALTRTIHNDPALWQILNRERQLLGLHPWKGNS